MRKRIVGGIVLALSGVLVLAVLNVNVLVRRHQDYLTGQAAQALGRRISVDRIEVTLWPVGARLLNFAMADDPAFSAADFLRAKALRIDFRVLPLLIGRLRLERMVLESPVIVIFRDAGGRYNLASYGHHEKSNRDSADSSENASVEKQGSELFLIASLNVTDGTLRYRDLESGRELAATQINLEINGFQWDEPFDVRLEAAVMAAQRNLKLRIRAGPIAGRRDYRDVPFDGDIQADALDLGKVNTALPQFKKALPRALRFDGVYTVKELKVKGTLNDLSLKGAVTGTDASFRFE